MIAGYWKLLTDRSEKRASNLLTATLTLAWFAILVLYVLIRKPAMYDGIRHFLFILPPIFIFSGFTFEYILDFIASHTLSNWLYAGLVVLILLPGILGILRLHPYEYTYYNSFIGGTRGAFRNYETDFWLTCYKEAVQDLNSSVSGPVNLYVHREPYIAEYYASDDMIVLDPRGAADQIQSGDYLLVNSRTNEDRRIYEGHSFRHPDQTGWRIILQHWENSMTTHRERIQAAIRGEIIDRPPVALWRHFPVDDQNPQSLAEAHLNYQQNYDFDLMKVTPASSFCLKDWGVEDEWVGDTEGTRRYTKRIIHSPEDWESLTVSGTHFSASCAAVGMPAPDPHPV